MSSRIISQVNDVTRLQRWNAIEDRAMSRAMTD